MRPPVAVGAIVITLAAAGAACANGFAMEKNYVPVIKDTRITLNSGETVDLQVGEQVYVGKPFKPYWRERFP